MQKQLSFNALNTGRALQGIDHVSCQAMLYVLAGDGDGAIGVKIADHALAAFVDKKSVGTDSLVIHSRVTGKNLRIDVGEDHNRRRTIVPGHHPGPHLTLALQQRPQMMRVEVPKVQDFSAERLRRAWGLDWSMKAHEGSCTVSTITVRRQRGKSLAFTQPFGKAVIHLREPRQ